MGAQKGDILRLIVGQGLKVVAIGVAIGLIAALAQSRVMNSLLFGVAATAGVAPTLHFFAGVNHSLSLTAHSTKTGRATIAACASFCYFIPIPTSEATT
jgi:hypothetical protein